MISHKHRCIYIHIPKTAGTSIEMAFIEDLGLNMDNRHALLVGENTNKNIGPQRISHLTANQYVEMHFISKELYDRYFKFSIVRNPLDRLYSIYKYMGFFYFISYDKFVKYKLKKIIDSKTDNYFLIPQYNYLFKNDVLQVDYIGRFETLELDFEYINSKLHASLNLKHYNQSNKLLDKSKIIRAFRNCRSYQGITKFNLLSTKTNNLSDDSLDIIYKYYKNDFDVFGYKIE